METFLQFWSNRTEQIRRQKLQAPMAAGQNPDTITCFDVTHRSEEITAHDQLRERFVSIAGRMTSRRISGQGFCPLAGWPG